MKKKRMQPAKRVETKSSDEFDDVDLVIYKSGLDLRG